MTGGSIQLHTPGKGKDCILHLAMSLCADKKHHGHTTSATELLVTSPPHTSHYYVVSPVMHTLSVQAMHALCNNSFLPGSSDLLGSIAYLCAISR